MYSKYPKMARQIKQRMMNHTKPNLGVCILTFKLCNHLYIHTPSAPVCGEGDKIAFTYIAHIGAISYSCSCVFLKA